MDKKCYTSRRHTLEVPFHSESELLGDLDLDGACGGSYVGDHGRLVGGYLGGQRLRDLGSERSEQLVVMRKLNLSERRDSFKKQEAVQEVSFDEPEEKTSPTLTVTAPSTRPLNQHRAAWVVTQPQSSEEVEMPVVRRFTLVPQIAVQGSTESEEQDEWEPCSDGEEDSSEKPDSADITPQQQTTAPPISENVSCKATEAKDSSASDKVEPVLENSQKGKLKK